MATVSQVLYLKKNIHKFLLTSQYDIASIPDDQAEVLVKVLREQFPKNPNER
jgi:hypothetical protein